MEIADILKRQAVHCGLKANSKKQVLQELAGLAAPLAQADERLVFDTLLERERLGSTGVGNGVAIPHGKLPGLAAITGVFCRLKKPVPFDAMDDMPVDLFFMLLAPEGSGADHLKALSRIARALRQNGVLSALRATDDPEIIYNALVSIETASAA